MYKIQISVGEHFLHEHPAAAASWTEDAIKELAEWLVVGITSDHMRRCWMIHGARYGPVASIQADTLEELYSRRLEESWGIPRLEIYCHRNWSKQQIRRMWNLGKIGERATRHVLEWRGHGRGNDHYVENLLK